MTQKTGYQAAHESIEKVWTTKRRITSGAEAGGTDNTPTEFQKESRGVVSTALEKLAYSEAEAHVAGVRDARNAVDAQFDAVNQTIRKISNAEIEASGVPQYGAIIRKAVADMQNAYNGQGGMNNEVERLMSTVGVGEHPMGRKQVDAPQAVKDALGVLAEKMNAVDAAEKAPHTAADLKKEYDRWRLAMVMVSEASPEGAENALKTPITTGLTTDRVLGNSGTLHDKLIEYADTLEGKNLERAGGDDLKATLRRHKETAMEIEKAISSNIGRGAALTA